MSMKQRPGLQNYIFFIAILFIANCQIVFGQNFLVEKDLRLDWIFYDEDEKVMLPFLENSNEYPVAMHLSIDLDYGKEAYLMVDIPVNTSLFLENRFVKHFDKNTIKYFLLDSLRDIQELKTFQLTLYKKGSFESPTDAKVGFIHKTFDSTIRVNQIVERNVDVKSDYIKIIILVLFTFFVVLHTLFQSELLAFLSLSTLITFRYTSTAFTKYRSLTKTQTLVIIYQAALLAGILIIFLNYHNNPLGQVFFL